MTLKHYLTIFRISITSALIGTTAIYLGVAVNVSILIGITVVFILMTVWRVNETIPCLFFHDWGRWEDYKIRINHVDSGLKDIELRQSRYCRNCSKRDDKKIR